MAFRVESRLGRGQVVDTFDAILEVHGEKLDVVIKRARPEYRDNAALQDALLEWGRAQATVDHPDVIAVLEAGRDQDGVYIIQERIEGTSLSRLLTTLRKSRRALTPPNALLIAERLAAGVAGIHRSPSGHHGDVRPGEVLVGYDGQVKVGDQRLGDLNSLVGLDLEPGAVNADYRAPGEVVSGSATDSYAVALVILEMMLGHPVWKTASMTVDDAQRALVDFAPVAQTLPDVAKELGGILKPCLHFEPDLRPTDMTAVANALTDLIDRYRVRRDPDGLGSFVEIVSPPLEDADAPTRMAVVPEAEPEIIAMAPDRRAAFEAASVVLTPEILAQAEAEYRQKKRGASKPPAVATDHIRARPAQPLPRIPSAAKSASTERPRPRSATLEGRSVPVDLPPAPSSLRDTAAKLPNVAAKAAAAMTEHGLPQWWPYVAIGLAVIFFGWWMSGTDARMIQLRVTSEPSAAEVFVDDQLVGQTPLTRPLEVRADRIDLRFEKDGYEAYRVTIGTQEDELRYEAPLKPVGSTLGSTP